MSGNKVCPECGSATVRVEFRDQFVKAGETFDPRSNGMWVVCCGCGREWPGESGSLWGGAK